MPLGHPRLINYSKKYGNRELKSNNKFLWNRRSFLSKSSVLKTTSRLSSCLKSPIPAFKAIMMVAADSRDRRHHQPLKITTTTAAIVVHRKSGIIHPLWQPTILSRPLHTLASKTNSNRRLALAKLWTRKPTSIRGSLSLPPSSTTTTPRCKWFHHPLSNSLCERCYACLKDG